MRLTTRDVALIRRLRYRDGLTIEETARLVGCSIGPVRTYAPGRPGKVPNDKLRAAFQASDMTPAEVARRLGWDNGRGCADSSRVHRTLGVTPQSKDGRRAYQRLVDAETAALMAEAIGVMPWEVMPDDAAAA